MEIHLAKSLKENGIAQDAAEWVRSCVHCGFCNATCPTYQLLGDEADGPRGRIYLIKKMLEDGEADARSRLHLDRCLLCRNCETTCPSGVEYGSLLEAGRRLQQDLAPRSQSAKWGRGLLTQALRKPQPLKTAIGVAQMVRPLLPAKLKVQLPVSKPNLQVPERGYERKIILLQGCVQPVLSPLTNAATRRVLDKFEIQVIEPPARCCGAMRLHTNDHETGLSDIRGLIDLLWPLVEQGLEAIVFTASGCGVTIKDYGHLLGQDAAYSHKAKKISELAKDISEVIAQEIEVQPEVIKPASPMNIAFHSPCTLQHGLKLNGVVEAILTALGHQLVPVTDSHLCCGSSGTYSIFQKDLSARLKADKLRHLQTHQPDCIATANIGCQQHLKTDATTNVVHWIELLEN